jgi:hypothetical protein
VYAYAKKDPCDALAEMAELMCVKHRSEYPNVHVLFRRTLQKMKEDAEAEAKRKAHPPSSSSADEDKRTRRGRDSATSLASTARSSDGGVKSPIKKKTRLGSTLPPSGGRQRPSDTMRSAPDEMHRSAKLSVKEICKPNQSTRKWMQEKQMKENERARMKEQMHAKELKWMEEITMKQNIRNKANAKLKAQEEERAKMASREAREKLASR